MWVTNNPGFDECNSPCGGGGGRGGNCMSRSFGYEWSLVAVFISAIKIKFWQNLKNPPKIKMKMYLFHSKIFVPLPQ